MAAQSQFNSHFLKLEQSVFRSLNAVVEPAVRFGIASPTFTPAGLIVLETVGFKSGLRRRTPLWSIKVGRYRIVSTARGDRSFWVKNILRQSVVSFYLGGRRRVSRAIVIAPGSPVAPAEDMNAMMRALVKTCNALTQKGWAFAILLPSKPC
jgi:hypothetical protein